MATQYKELSDEFVAVIKDDIFRRVGEGDFSNAGELPDNSVEAVFSRINRQYELSGRMRRSRSKITNIGERSDINHAIRYLRYLGFSEECLLGEVPMFQTLPDSLDKYYGNTPFLFMMDDKHGCLDAQVQRLMKLGCYLEQSDSALVRAPKRWRNMAEMDAMLLKDHCDEVIRIAVFHDYHSMPRLHDACNAALVAGAEHLARLKRLPTQDSMAIGEEQLSRLMDYAGYPSIGKTNDMMDSMLRTLNREQVHYRNILIKKYGLPKDISRSDLLAHLKNNFSIKKDEAVPKLKETYRRMLSFAEHTDLLHMPEDSSIRIQETPAYLENMVSQLMVFLPGLLGNKLETICYVTPRHDANSLSLPADIAHEVFGHVYQWISAMQNKSDIRKWMLPDCTSEGYSVYMERLLPELFEFKDEVMYALLCDLQRVPARAKTQITLLTGNQDYLQNSMKIVSAKRNLYAKCVDIYSQLTGYSMPDAHNELNDFSRSGLYPLSYGIGYMAMKEIARLFDDPKDMIAFVAKEGNIPAGAILKAARHHIRADPSRYVR